MPKEVDLEIKLSYRCNNCGSKRMPVGAFDGTLECVDCLSIDVDIYYVGIDKGEGD